MEIITTAYKNTEYIEDFISSVPKYVTINLGIDGCKDTLEKAKSIHKYHNNLRVFYSEQNVGTYIMRNSLINHLDLKKDILLFDSDDVMIPELITEINKIHQDSDIIRFKYYIVNEQTKTITKGNTYAKGAMFITNDALRQLGGYRPYRFAADGELIYRAEKNKMRILGINKHLFYYRVHNNSLTSTVDINKRIDLHRAYRELNDIYVEPQVTELIEIDK